MLSKYLQAEEYINQGLIRSSVPNTPNKLTRREWMLKFLDDLGHPERAFPAVHIAGTSGKGSTAIMIAEIVRASGLKVGLHTTPYLQVQTEKLWYDGTYASAEEFVELVEWIKPICEKWRAPEVPLHGMASFGICLEYFRRRNVDIAVIETGVGGRDDMTNILNTKLSVITPLGLDHVITLGDTLESIATHKAGIIKRDTPVVAFKGPGHEVIAEEAKKKSAPLTWVESKQRGARQMNLKVANAAARQLGIEQDSDIEVTLPGRMETLQENPKVIIDGAHNFQKIEALLKTVRSELVEERTVFIFGMLKSKTNLDILSLIRGHKGKLILAEPKVYGKEATDPKELARLLERSDAIIEPEPKQALKKAIEISDTKDTILCFGSLYLAGNIRELYFPSSEIIKKRTSWS